MKDFIVIAKEFHKESIPYIILFTLFAAIFIFLAVKPLLKLSKSEFAKSKSLIIIILICVFSVLLFMVPVISNFIDINVGINKDIKNNSFLYWEGYVERNRKHYWMQVEVGDEYFYIGENHNFLRGEKGNYYAIIFGENSQLIFYAVEIYKPSQ